MQEIDRKLSTINEWIARNASAAVVADGMARQRVSEQNRVEALESRASRRTDLPLNPYQENLVAELMALLAEGNRSEVQRRIAAMPNRDSETVRRYLVMLGDQPRDP